MAPIGAPAVEASGISRPARIYDLRSTFATDALAAGIGLHPLARIMGTSVRMIERHHGVLLDGAMESIAARLDAYDAAGEDVSATSGPRAGACTAVHTCRNRATCRHS